MLVTHTKALHLRPREAILLTRSRRSASSHIQLPEYSCLSSSTLVTLSSSQPTMLNKDNRGTKQSHCTMQMILVVQRIVSAITTPRIKKDFALTMASRNGCLYTRHADAFEGHEHLWSGSKGRG
jgi:uncharacterized membrane protein YjjP (DUF1212 family)